MLSCLCLLLLLLASASAWRLPNYLSLHGNVKEMQNLQHSSRIPMTIYAGPPSRPSMQSLAEQTVDKKESFENSKLYTGLEVIVVLILISAVDGGFSGDWSRYGLITKEVENQLRTFLGFAGIGHILLGALAGVIAYKRNHPVLPAALRTALVGFMSLNKVIKQTDENAIDFPSIKSLKQSIVSNFAGEYDSVAINKSIDQDLTNNKYVMYSFRKCPYCLKAKSILLDKYELNMKVIELDDDKRQGSAIRLELSKRTGRTSVPSIWIQGQFIGGCNDGPQSLYTSSGKMINTKGGVVALDAEGQLQALLK
jgi:glutaredoxin 3